MSDKDHVDAIVEQWNRERPDLDVSAMAVFGRLGRLNKIIGGRLDTVFDSHGLESWEFDVLATLVRNGTPYELTPGELLDSMMITSGTMTNRISRLENRGLVTRTKSPTDGRQVLVRLTNDGHTIANACLQDHVANETAMLTSLTAAQQQTLVTLLRQLEQGLEPAERAHIQP